MGETIRPRRSSQASAGTLLEPERAESSGGTGRTRLPAGAGRPPRPRSSPPTKAPSESSARGTRPEATALLETEVSQGAAAPAADEVSDNATGRLDVDAQHVAAAHRKLEPADGPRYPPWRRCPGRAARLHPECPDAAVGERAGDQIGHRPCPARHSRRPGGPGRGPGRSPPGSPSAGVKAKSVTATAGGPAGGGPAAGGLSTCPGTTSRFPGAQAERKTREQTTAERIRTGLFTVPPKLADGTTLCQAIEGFTAPCGPVKVAYVYRLS